MGTVLGFSDDSQAPQSSVADVIHWEFPNDMPWHLCVFVGRDGFKGDGFKGARPCLDASFVEFRV